MRGLSRAAALLLAPALARGALIDESNPSALIIFEVPGISVDDNDRDLTLRLKVFESEGICDKANVRLNDQALFQDEDGFGHATLFASERSTMVASWKFTCVTLDDEPQEQLLTFNIDTVDGQPIQDIGFLARFQQTAPVVISEIAGPVRVSQTDPGEKEEPEPEREPGRDDDDLEAQIQVELQDLEFLHIQAAELRELIAMKERYITDEFGVSVKKGIGACDNLKCVFKSIVDKVSGVATEFYDEILGENQFYHRHHGPHHGPHRRPGWKHRRPHWRHRKHRWHHGNHTHGHNHTHHGNHTHGNHTWPHPPWRPPHWRPPFCHFPPHGPPHGPPHHPGKPPHGPPHPPGKPPHGPPRRPGKPPHKPPHNERPPWDEDERPLHDDFPPPPQHPPSPGPKDPHHHGFHRPPPPPGTLPPRRRIPPVIKFGVIGFVVLSILGMLHRRFFRLSREERRALRQARRNAFRRRRARFHQRREACRGAVRDFFRRIFRRVCDEEEKEAMLAEHRRRRSGLESSAAGEETTMEQEFANFREAAQVVGELVAAEEGRVTANTVRERREGETIQIAGTIPSLPLSPPTPMGSFPDYVGVEDLPAYEADDSDSAVVADGFRYAPGSSEYTPSSSSDAGSTAGVVLGGAKN